MFNYGVNNLNSTVNNGSKRDIKVVPMDCTTPNNGCFSTPPKSLPTNNFKED